MLSHDEAGLEDQKSRLGETFKNTIATLDGVNSEFLRALEHPDDTRHALDELCDFDAIQDGFLLLPALENMCALPLVWQKLTDA